MPGQKQAYVSIAGRSAFIRKLRDDGSDWTTAWDKILAKYPGSSISNCKKVWEKAARTPKADNQINTKKKTGKLAVIVGLAKAGKNEKQIQAEIKNQYGLLSNNTMYIIGREWRRVNGCLRQ